MAEHKKPDYELDQYHLPPPKLSRWETFQKFMWNSERREFMGRTAEMWVKVLVFYMIFYSALAAFFVIFMFMFLQTVEDREPKWKLDVGLIGKNPGLGFRPEPPTKNIESVLIWMKVNKAGDTPHVSVRFYTDSLNAYLKEYENIQTTGKDVDAPSNCQFGQTRDNPDKYCPFDISDARKNELGPCNVASDNYGYSAGTPCVLVKMNKIYNWMPNCYANEGQVPWMVKAALKYDKDNPNNMADNQNKYFDRSMVFLTCVGENPADEENMGPVRYYPRPGYPHYYYPYTNQNGYKAPFVFVHFTNPKRGVLINVECKVWAKNLEHSRQERHASVHFEILVDD